MVTKLKIRSFSVLFFSVITLSVLGMQKDEAPKALREICCKSISNYLAKSSNAKEALAWIGAKKLPQELEEIVEEYTIKNNKAALRAACTRYLQIKQHPWDKHWTAIEDAVFKSGNDKDSVIIIEFAKQADNIFKMPVRAIRATSDSKFLFINNVRNNKRNLMILSRDNQTRKYSKATLQEIGYLIAYGNCEIAKSQELVGKWFTEAPSVKSTSSCILS